MTTQLAEQAYKHALGPATVEDWQRNTPPTVHASN